MIAERPGPTASTERGTGRRWVLSGTVTAHGKAVPVDVLIDRMPPEENGMRVHARTGHLDRHAFGITGSKGMVGRYLDLHFDMLAERV
jgi:hypothetical protein